MKNENAAEVAKAKEAARAVVLEERKEKELQREIDLEEITFA